MPHQHLGTRIVAVAVPEPLMCAAAVLLFLSLFVTDIAASWCTKRVPSSSLGRSRVSSPPRAMLDSMLVTPTTAANAHDAITGLLALSGVGIFAPPLRKLIAITERSKHAEEEDEELDEQETWVLSWEEEWYLTWEEVEVEVEDEADEQHGFDDLIMLVDDAPAEVAIVPRLHDELAAAVAREDYKAAALLKRELDDALAVSRRLDDVIEA